MKYLKEISESDWNKHLFKDIADFEEHISYYLDEVIDDDMFGVKFITVEIMPKAQKLFITECI